MELWDYNTGKKKIECRSVWAHTSRLKPDCITFTYFFLLLYKQHQSGTLYVRSQNSLALNIKKMLKTWNRYWHHRTLMSEIFSRSSITIIRNRTALIEAENDETCVGKATKWFEALLQEFALLSSEAFSECKSIQNVFANVSVTRTRGQEADAMVKRVAWPRNPYKVYVLINVCLSEQQSPSSAPTICLLRRLIMFFEHNLPIGSRAQYWFIDDRLVDGARKFDFILMLCIV